jgi:ribA/ribD-fused uncharacterized protein
MSDAATRKLYPLDQYEKFLATFSAHAIEYKGKLYPTVEHAYHASRYVDEKIQEEIRAAKSPYIAWELSQKYKAGQMSDFDARKSAVMEEICRLKLTQHEDVKAGLLASGDDTIVKNYPDPYWGIGPNGVGKNEMGVIWMKLRSELI